MCFKDFFKICVWVVERSGLVNAGAYVVVVPAGVVLSSFRSVVDGVVSLLIVDVVTSENSRTSRSSVVGVTKVVALADKVDAVGR